MAAKMYPFELNMKVAGKMHSKEARMAHSTKMICTQCGAEMNHHATKIEYGMDDDADMDPVFGGVLQEAHMCPSCGRTELRPASGAANL